MRVPPPAGPLLGAKLHSRTSSKEINAGACTKSMPLLDTASADVPTSLLGVAHDTSDDVMYLAVTTISPKLQLSPSLLLKLCPIKVIVCPTVPARAVDGLASKMIASSSNTKSIPAE
eukprot:3941272-Rhodomonas_salina.3